MKWNKNCKEENDEENYDEENVKVYADIYRWIYFP